MPQNLSPDRRSGLERLPTDTEVRAPVLVPYESIYSLLTHVIVSKPSQQRI